jgi:hypothetical protein
MSLTKEQCIQKVKTQIGNIRDKVESQSVSESCDLALLETGWTFPMSNTFMEYWIIARTKRHLFYQILTVSAYKFKFKQINLQNRFEHFRFMVRDCDREFKEAMEEHPELFTNVDIVHSFGTKIDAGFRYDELGRDITYGDSNLVQLDPNDASG